MADDVKDINEEFEYDKNAWDEIRREAAIDMQFVAGDPWTDDDKKQRKDRPSVAPEEMSQYRNQVINVLRANPRGMKFSPVGNGANDKTAAFYQNKSREIEYRSHASNAYVIAATNAIERSYGYLRVETRYASPRSANQELWIEGFPDPDMVYLDADAKRPDSSDMKRALVLEWMPQAEFKRAYPKAKIKDFSALQSAHPSWIQGNRILRAERWSITTKERKLLLCQPIAQPGQPAPRPVQLFEDEVLQNRGAVTVIRELRKVDYPSVTMQLTNGVEILHEQDWPGKYIPIVSCYGKVLYVPEGGETKKKILSMTRFGRDPWKSYCYACSQQLEVLGMVPKAPVLVVDGQLDGFEKDWQESPHVPKAFLKYRRMLPGQTEALPPPQRLEYLAGEHLQALELVKEGFRRAIQSAMGSNFLPTQAQKRNEKSGRALDKMDQAAAQGTYHFVNSYEDLIRQTGVIVEDLIPSIYDYEGETGVMEADGAAKMQAINNPANQDAIGTTGDHIVTISTAPSSDSEREAAQDFTDTVVGNLETVAKIAGPKAAAAVLARSIKMRNLGPLGDQLAELIEPPEFKQGAEGKPPDPHLMALQQENQHLKGILQQAAQEKQAKVVEQDGKFKIALMQEQAESERAAADREVKMAVAELSARVDRMALLIEESRLVGARRHEASQAAHDRVHESIEATKDRAHEHIVAGVAHERALETADVSHTQALEQQEQAAALTPQPEAGV